MTSYQRPARLTIYTCDSAMHHHKPLSEVVVRRAHEAGLSGATVLRGVEGYGRSGDIRTIRMVDVADHLPIAITIVDDERRLREFVAHNPDCLDGRLITLEELEVYSR
jgi:uncharacterized protein